MIQIRQDIYDIKTIEKYISKHGITSIHMDKNLIEDDIQKLSNKAMYPLSKYDKANIEASMKYLRNLLDKLNGSELMLFWESDGNVVKSNPIEIRNIQEYSIDMSNYILLGKEKLIHLEYSELLDIIAIEMMYRDLGETLKSMEDKLSHIGITSVVNCRELLDHFEPNIYSLSKSFRVGDSPYSIFNGKKITEYFGRKSFTTGRYRECVEYSIKHALTIIAGKIFDGLSSMGITPNLCSVGDGGIYILLDNTDNIEKVISERVSVRAFGRQFMVQPKIAIY